jgi:hypothetical protein
MATAVEIQVLRAAYITGRHKGHRHSATSNSNYHTDVTYFSEVMNE